MSVLQVNRLVGQSFERPRLERATTKAMAQRIEVLEARLSACVAVLEVLATQGHIRPQNLETVERVLRHADAALAE